MRLTRRLAAGVTALVLATTGCSSEEAGTGAGADGFNDADVSFATDMVQHHAQALAMVDLTLGRDLSPELADLAEQIRQAQAPEIERMVDWLEEWDQPVPETVRDHANAHRDDHGGTGETVDDMPGMMSPEQMAALEAAPDAEFEDLWLSMMVEHHEGAVAMAEEVRATGESEETSALAADIIEAQQAETERMQALLAD